MGPVIRRSAKPRCFVRYRLVSLLFLTAIAAILVWHFSSSNRAIRRLETSGVRLLDESAYSYDGNGNLQVSVMPPSPRQRLSVGNVHGVLAPELQNVSDVFHDLRVLRNVEMICLEDAWVTDSDLSRLTKLDHLRFLDLSGTRISDAGLSQLVPLASLETVVVCRTGLTSLGMQEFQKARPSVNIVRQYH